MDKFRIDTTIFDEDAIGAERLVQQHNEDFVIVIGGDGTLLKAASLFNNCISPPILSFHMGTLAYLIPFSMCRCLMYFL